MGESMLDSVIWAREQHLAPGGVVLPNHATLYLVAVDDADFYKDHVEFWDDVYGFKMPSMRESILVDPGLVVMDPDAVLSPPVVLNSVDMLTCLPEETDFATDFQLVMSREGVCAAVCGYFDVEFSEGCQSPVFFCTSPRNTPTHWKQTLFYLEKPLAVKRGDILSGRLSSKRDHVNPRELNVTLQCQLESLE